MIGKVVVLQPNDYEAWLQGAPIAPQPVLASGQALFNNLACATCHQDGDTAFRLGRAPSLTGIYGLERQLIGGRSTTVDDNYLRESILDPAEKVVDGYQPIMPTYKGQITEEELMRLISYLKTLGDTRAAAVDGGPLPTPKTEG